MHNCGRIYNKLVDLVFNEIGENERFALLQELNACQQCRELYRDMSNTMILFDRVTEEAMPEESYWATYEDKLWQGLRDEIRPAGWRQKFINWIDKAIPRFLLPVAAAALVLLMIGGLWMMLARRGDMKSTGAIESVANDSAQEHSPINQIDGAQANTSDKPIDKQKTGNAPPPGPIKKSSKTQKRGLELVSLPNTKDDTIIEESRRIAALNLRLTEHLENSMMLLRSFRNARPSANESLVDISFEKEQARSLLSSNITLRQEIEALGDLRSNELLTGLEPFLLDIANLPDRASLQEMGMIKNVLEEFGLITELQIYSALALQPAL
jgi:hypothetical protein